MKCPTKGAPNGINFSGPTFMSYYKKLKNYFCGNFALPLHLSRRYWEGKWLPMKGPRVWFSITGADPLFRGSGSQARWGQGESGRLFCWGVAGGCGDKCNSPRDTSSWWTRHTHCLSGTWSSWGWLDGPEWNVRIPGAGRHTAERTPPAAVPPPTSASRVTASEACPPLLPSLTHIPDATSFSPVPKHRRLFLLAWCLHCRAFLHLNALSCTSVWKTPIHPTGTGWNAPPQEVIRDLPPLGRGLLFPWSSKLNNALPAKCPYPNPQNL